MEIFTLIPLASIFLYINYKIIKQDIREKIIANRYLKYLLYLIPYTYMWLWYFGYLQDLSLMIFILQVLLTFSISFALYHFGMWGAGDAKYLGVLSLFIPHIGIIPLIGNIAIVTLIYLLFYFIWFWFGPNLWNKNKRKKLYREIWDIKKREFLTLHTYINKYDYIIGILKQLNLFFLLFISLRFLRIQALDFLHTHYNISLLTSIIQKNGIYIVLIVFAFIFFIYLLIRYILSVLKNYFGIQNSLLFILCVNILGIAFLAFEYIRDPIYFGKNIITIITLYLGLYIIFKIILFAYKLVFIYQEESLIHINDLKEGMFIDKGFLLSSFKGQRNIFSVSEIQSLTTCLNNNSLQLIRRKYKNINTFVLSHTDKNSFVELQNIKIKKTFSFGMFIFSGFLMVFLFYL